MSVRGLICTGFHRSGTSLAAKRLQRAGLSLGEHLLPAHPSNPDGHYEDSLVVEFNDGWLQRQGSNWLFHDEVHLAVDAELRERISSYVASRDAGGAAWALKDPRITVSLPAWADALGERGRYLLMVRHWGECAQSLFQRHSREMAHHLLNTRPGANANFRFWLEPNAAYLSWLAYNARLLEFAAARPEQAVIVTARAMAGMGSLQPLVGERLGIVLERPDAEAGLRPELLSRRVSAAILPPPPLWLERSLDAMWHDLLALSERRSPDEGVEWRRRGMAGWVRAGIESAVGDRFPDRDGHLAPPRAAAEAAPGEQTSQTVALLGLVPESQRGPRALASARRAFAEQRYDDAETVLLGALAAGATPYALLLLLGDIDTARRRHEAALARYRAALATRVTDPGVMKAVRCLMTLKRWQEATDLLEPLLERSPDHGDARLARARCLERLAGPDTAVLSLLDPPEADLALLNARAQLTMSYDVDGGLQLYRDGVRLRLSGQDLVSWLASACLAIPTPAAWEAFVQAVYRHWTEILGRDAVHRRLGLATLPDPARFAAGLGRESLPPVAIGGASGAGGCAAATALQALGWFLGETLDEDNGHLGFARAFAAPLPLDADGDDPSMHAALCRFLEGMARDLEARPRPPRGWGWWHRGTSWFAAALLSAIPDLRYVHVLDPSLGLHDDEGFQRWAPAILGRDDLPPSSYWKLKYAVASHRRLLAVQAAWPERVFLLDPRQVAAARGHHLRQWLWHIGWEDEAPAHWPGPGFRHALQAADAADLVGGDPADLAFLRQHGLLA